MTHSSHIHLAIGRDGDTIAALREVKERGAKVFDLQRK